MQRFWLYFINPSKVAISSLKLDLEHGFQNRVKLVKQLLLHSSLAISILIVLLFIKTNLRSELVWKKHLNLAFQEKVKPNAIIKWYRGLNMLVQLAPSSGALGEEFKRPWSFIQKSLSHPSSGILFTSVMTSFQTWKSLFLILDWNIWIFI